MNHWRQTNQPKQQRTGQTSQPGIELSLSELLETKRYADSLELPSRQKVKNHLLGGFISHHKGRGMDFDEARPYQMGDDIRSIDWRVTARTGRAHTKIYREEKERPVFVLLDQTAGMMFGTKRQFKSVQAAKIASLIMWRTLADGNRFGTLLFDEFSQSQYKPASSRKNCLRILNQIVDNHNQQVERIYLDAKTGNEQPNPAIDSLLPNTLRRARQLTRPGSLIFLISDFQNFDADAEHHLLRLSQHNEVHLIRVADAIEENLPPAGVYTITNGKQRLSINTQQTSFRDDFNSQFRQQNHYLQQLCIQHRMRWSLLTTDLPLHQVLATHPPATSESHHE